MSQVVVRLVQRLASPAAASALAKEELCLALAAAAQLRPLSVATPAAPNATSSSPVIAAAALARRSLRVIPQCSPQELRMVAQGASALEWPSTPSSPFVVDALVQALYRHVTHRGGSAAMQRGGRVRLADVLAVVGHAMDAQEFFNATLHVLLMHDLEALVGEAAAMSTATATELVAVVCGYLGEKEGVALVRQLHAALAASPASASPGMAVLAECTVGKPLAATSAWASRYTKWSQQRSGVLEALTASSPSDVDDPASASRHKAKRVVLQAVLHLRAEEKSAAAGESAVNDEALLEAMEAVKVFQLYDPVTTIALDEALQRRATAMVPETRLAFEGFVYAQAQRFPRTLAVLRECDAAAAASDDEKSASGTPSEALQHVSAVQRCYEAAGSGAAITEKELFLVSEDVNAYGADDVARALFVFAYAKDVPARLPMLLAGAVASLTADGVVALLRATRQDRAGALRTIAAACLTNTALVERCVAAASAASLVDLAGVLAVPHTRWTTTPAEVSTLEAQLQEAVLTQLHVHVATLPWDTLLSVVRVVGRLPAGAATVRVACDHLAAQLRSAITQPAAVVPRCVAVVEALLAGDVVAEELLDVVVEALRAHFTSLATADADDARHDEFLRFAALEVSYGAPELAEAMASVTQVVTRTAEWAATPVQLLVAAALLSLDSGRIPASSAAALTLPYRILHHVAAALRMPERVSAELAVAVTELVCRLSLADTEAVAYCAEAVLPVAAALPPPNAARLVAAAHDVMRRSGRAFAVPPEAYAHVAASVRALPPDVFTTLCGAAASDSFDEALANRLVDVMPLVADLLTPAQLSRCVFGLGEMRGAGQRLSHQVMTEALSDYAVDNVELFTRGVDIATLLHGFAKLLCTKRNLYSVFTKLLHRRSVLSTLDFQSISFLMFALGSVKFVDQKLMNVLCLRFEEHVDHLTAPDLFMALRGVSRMCLLNSPFYWILGHAAARKVDEFPLHAQCELLHAFGSIEQRHPLLCNILARSIAANADALPSASAAVAVIYSLWLVDFKVAAEDSVKTLVNFIVQHADELSSNDLVKLCFIVRESFWTNLPLLNTLANRSLQLHAEQKLEGSVARAVLDTLAHRFVCHVEARTELSQLARSVSKEVTQLSGDEEEQLKLLIGH